MSKHHSSNTAHGILGLRQMANTPSCQKARQSGLPLNGGEPYRFEILKAYQYCPKPKPQANIAIINNHIPTLSHTSKTSPMVFASGSFL